MIRIKKLDELSIQIITDDRAYIIGAKDYFTDYVEGFRFQPRFKAGGWDGKISMLSGNRSLPYGLLFDLIKFHKTYYKDIELKIDDDVKDFFTGVWVDPEYDLNIFPRPYQIECIDACLKYRSGIIVAATASGKSCTITYIIKALMSENKIKKALIIVPTINLVTQFHTDMIEYGIDEHLLGRVYSKIKEFDKEIVISTWQTLSKNYDRLDEFDCVICDEVHSAKAYIIRTILSRCTKAKFRYGFTGTMPPTKLETWNVKAYLGPILKTFGAAELAEQGYISHCKVNYININYHNRDKYTGDYNSVKEMVFNNPNRLAFIRRTVATLDGNVLVLVGKVEKEGELLKQYLSDIKDKEVVFIWGDTKPEEREFWRLELGKRNNIILIATYQLFQLGINAPTLKYLLFATPYKSKIRTLQSIGRTLRLHENKDNAVIFDIADNVPFLEDHAARRMRYYKSEKFEIDEMSMDEDLFIL